MSKILYNVTMMVAHDAVDSWKEYMIGEHILDVMNTGCFESFKMNKLRYVDEKDGITFAVQYVAKSEEHFDEYNKEHAPALQKDHQQKFGEKALAFRTVMDLLFESEKS